MTEHKSGARERDDDDLQDAKATPSQSGSSGGATARDVGTRDEGKSATGGDPEPTRATKQDKVQSSTKAAPIMKADREIRRAALL